MRHAWMVVSLLSVLNPCSKKSGDNDAAAEASAPIAADDAAAAASDAAAATPAVADPVAKNTASVARFPNDTKLGNQKDKLVADLTVARESPGGGKAVATLKKDLDVTKVASHGDFFLIAFADPKDSASTLVGWIPAAGFSPTPPTPKTCPKGQVKFAGGCKFDCSKNACPAGMACTGLGSRPEISDGAIPYCETVTDAGAPVSTDAGAPPVVVDAGAPKRPTCPAGQVGWDDQKCHVQCKTNKDCVIRSVCTPMGGGLSGCLP